MNKFKSWIIRKLGGYTEQLPPPKVVQINLRPETFVVSRIYSREHVETFGEDIIKEITKRDFIEKLVTSKELSRFIEWRFRQDGSGDFHYQARLSVVDMSEVRDYRVGFERTI